MILMKLQKSIRKIKNEKRYNKKFIFGLLLFFLIYSIGDSYFIYNWKTNVLFIIIVAAYITIWDATHPVD